MKDNALLEQKINYFNNPRSIPKTIIFAATEATCNHLQAVLRRAGYNVAALHGGKSQANQDETMSAFRRGKVSDIVARGLDVNVPCVCYIKQFNDVIGLTLQSHTITLNLLFI